MNFKRTAEKLEKFLEEELTRTPPIALLHDGSLVYNNFIIKKNCKQEWELKRASGNVLDTFNLKSIAIGAAKLYSSNNFKYYNEIKILDTMYAKNSADADRFKIRYQTTNDLELRDLYVARHVEAKVNADFAKKQIVKQFKTLFWSTARRPKIV